MATKKNTKKSNEAYFVAWAEYESDTGVMTSGVLGNIYATEEAARREVMRLLKETVQDEMDMYDESEWMEIFGSKDADEIVRRHILNDYNHPRGFILFKNPTTDVEQQYTIEKYYLRYLKK